MLSGQRQIRAALDLFGISPGAKDFLLFSVPKNEIDALIADFSLENLNEYRKNFKEAYGISVKERTIKLMGDLGLARDKGRISRNEIIEFLPDRRKIGSILDLQDITIPKRAVDDHSYIERAICERINLIHCR